MFKTLEKLRNLLKAEFGDEIKKYFIDDPNLIPMSMLPCFAVTPISTEINVADTGRDQYTYSVDIYFIISALRELKKYNEEMVGARKLAEIMEKRDSDGNLDEHTVLYVLRNNLTLGSNWMINNISSIDYGIRPRPEQGITKEAACRLEVIRIKNR